MTDFKKKSTVRKSMLLVTGMHRSGTSALTRVLNFSGATLPKALLAPVKGENEKGFWESQRIMEFHDELLESLGGDWNALHSVPSQWFSSDEAGFYKAKLIDLIKNEFDEFETAVIKDPRICKLSPLWNAALTEMGIAPHYIVCVRSPIEVAQSLGVRNGYSRSYSINLWFNYLTAIEKSTRGLKRVFISYDNLLADPSEVISRVDGFFDLSLDGRTDVFEEKVRAFLSSSLRHHHLDMNDVQDTPEVVKHFYSWLERQCASQAIDTDFGYELNIEEALEKSPNSDFSLLQKGVRQTEQQLNQTYSAVQKLSQQHASSTKREAEQIKDIENLNILLQKELSQSEILENQYRQLVSQHLSLKERHVELERQNLAFMGRHLELEKRHLVLDRKCDRNDDEISRMKERFSNEADTKRNKLSSLREEHEVELQRHLKQTQILNQKLVQHKSLIELNAGMSEKLRTAEKHSHDQSRIIAWKLGIRITGAIRYLRSSLIGRIALMVKALFTFNLRRYLAFQKRLRIVQKSRLFDETFYLKTYPLIRYSTKTAIEHYVGVGEREGRQPNAVFAPYFYMQNRPDGIAKWESALVHYIKEGADNGDNPSPTFSTKFYAQAHQLPFTESLVHYLQESTKSGRTSLTEPGVTQESAKTALEISIIDCEPAVVGPIETEIFGLMNELERVTLDEKISALNFVVVEEPLVSIIIPFFNKLEYTVDCLFALSRQAFKNYEVILVDDASTNNDCSILNSIGGIEIIRNETNQGYLLSCNLAASASSGGYIVQLNNDTLVLEGWLSNLVNTFEIDSAVGLVGSLLLSRNGQISEAGGIIFNDASGYNYGRGKSPYEKRFNYCREVDYCSGASIIIKRHIWESLGGYDKTFVPAYYEDTDLAMQVRELGYKVVYNPLSKVVHHEGISSGTNLESGIKKYQEINKGKFYKKWTKVLDAKPPIPSGDLIDDYVRRQRKSGWILWIDSVTPTPDKDSGSIDTVNFFEQAITDDWGVTFMPWDGLRHEGRYTTSLLSMGVECIFDPSSSAEQHLNALGDSYDVIVLSRVTVAKYAYPIVKKLYPNAKIIFNTVDLHFLRYERESALLAKTSKLQLSVRSQKVDKEEELELVRNCDATIVVSESEQTVLNNYIESAKVKVIPLFRDVVGCSNSYEQRFDIGFIGGYQHPPNIDAVKYFISDVWPLVSKKIKHCKFIIAGSNAPEEILRLAGPRIEVRGFIPTVSELLEDVKLMVAPLRYGAGIKGKIVSGLCHGVPQVVTAEAADGMGLESTGAVIIADDAQQFANAIIELYSNDKKWNEMSLLALDAARQNYSKDAISGKITDLLNEL